MKLKYSGNFESLQLLVMLTGIVGEWCRGENHHQYRANSGAVLNWWKSTGTVTFQGPDAEAANLKAVFVKVAADPQSLHLVE